jgi:hypothetical protein
VETVNRSYYQRVVPSEARPRPEGEPVCGNAGTTGALPIDPLQLESTDRVRLEMTVSEGRELHSWPGATRFDARDDDELIRNGPVSTGAFGGHLASILVRAGVDQPHGTLFLSLMV